MDKYCLFLDGQKIEVEVINSEFVSNTEIKHICKDVDSNYYEVTQLIRNNFYKHEGAFYIIDIKKNSI